MESKLRDYGYLPMEHCHISSFIASPLGRSSNKKARHQERKGRIYPFILNVRQFGDSLMLSHVTHGPVARYNDVSLILLLLSNYLIFTIPVLYFIVRLKDKSIWTIFLHLGHFTLIIPLVGVTLSKIRHPHLGQRTITFISPEISIHLLVCKGIRIIQIFLFQQFEPLHADRKCFD